MPQGFSQNVRQLLHCPNGLKLNLVLLNTLMYVMKSDINVLAVVIEDMIPTKRDG